MTNKTTLATKMRPTVLNEIVGQKHLLGNGQMLREMIKTNTLKSIILYGPPGTGKTTIASVIANTTKSDFKQINAATAAKTDIKSIVENAQILKDTDDRKTILFIDEIHEFYKAQQDYLLPFVESGLIILIGATTENPFSEINKDLLYKSTIFELKPIEKCDIIELVDRACTDPKGYGSADFKIDINQNVLNILARFACGSAEKALNTLEFIIKTTDPDDNNIIHIDENVTTNYILTIIMPLISTQT